MDDYECIASSKQGVTDMCEVRILKGGQFNLSAASIGIAGKAAVHTIMNKPEYVSEHFCLEPLKEGDSYRQIQHREDIFLLRCDYCWMLVFADLGEEGALEAACACAKAFCREKKHPSDIVAFVTMDKYVGTDMLRETEVVFDKIFLVESVDQLHLPLVLFRNVESEYGFIGVDYADVTANFDRAKIIHVTQDIYPDIQQAITQTEVFLARQEEKQKRFGCRYGNMCIIGSYDTKVFLSEIEDAMFGRMVSEDGDDEVIIHAVNNTQEEDTTETIIVFNCVKQKK